VSVSNGQVANETTFNNAFASRTANTSLSGVVQLLGALAASGATIANLQRELNALNSFLGGTINSAKDYKPTWTNNDVGTSTDDVKTRVDVITLLFNNGAGGHTHDGSDGQGGQIDAGDLANLMANITMATTAAAGKVLLADDAPPAIASAGSAGTDNGAVANEDHTHAGVHSVAVDGETPLLGDVEFVAGTNVELDQVGQQITISATGGGGGGSLQWVEAADSPTPEVEANMQVYKFESGLGQKIYALVRVPSTYVAGSPINLRMAMYSQGTTGDARIATVATLIRVGVDAITSTTNQHSSTNSAITLGAGTVNKPQNLVLDLTEGDGQINGVAVSPNDLILVQLTRDATILDTAPEGVAVPVYGAEVTFQ
jgi:hypothetical protein